jgi:hypothetical protein
MTQSQDNAPRDDVKVLVAADTSQDALDIELIYAGERALEIYEHSLPWRGALSIILVAVHANALGTPLDKEVPIDDPTPDTLLLEPGTTYRGRISLPSRFPGFAEARRSRDVIVFWSYALQSIDGEQLPRSGGFLLFPKRS